jgi:tRNA pseudouridine55 synthase
MVLTIYKRRGWTSNDVVQKLKHSCGFAKVGHAGTLDPLAEGVLLVLTDADTKRQSEFMDLPKEYLVKVAFGYESDSHDLGTPVRLGSKAVADNLTREALAGVLEAYVGKTRQQVPVYSAVHVAGQRLYKVARTNAASVLSPPYKAVEIYALTICSFAHNEQLCYPELSAPCTVAEFRVSCGKGTYIRALVRDVGIQLGCGAVVVALTRTKVGEFSAVNADSVDSIIAKYREASPEQTSF